MSWVTVGVAAVGATSGYLKGKRNEKVADMNNALRKASIQYSPWTKMSDPGAGPSGPGAMEAGLGGGLQGAMMGSAISGGMGAAKPASGLTAGATTVDPTAFTPAAAGAAPGTMVADGGMAAAPGMEAGAIDGLDPTMSGGGKMGRWNQMMKMMQG